MSQGVIQGTIPYLGTFLTDLVMLDTAMKDYLYVSELGAGWAGAGSLRPKRTVPGTESEPAAWHAPPHESPQPVCRGTCPSYQ